MKTSVASLPLSALIRLQSHDPPAGTVVIQNDSVETVRIWRPGNSWGDQALSFELVASHTTHLTRALQDYTRNVPAILEVAPGAHQELPFDLGDGTWQPASALGQLSDARARIAAIYSGGCSVESAEQRVWPGKISSPYVSLH